MIEFLTQLIPAVVILGILIFVHEWGHFLACRFAGVSVEKFSIGFGPELASWQGRQTRYSISLVPFGGYVKPQGESYEEIEKQGGAPKPGDFLAASRWNRFFILVAGVTMNFFLAYVLFVVVMVMGRPVPAPQIGKLLEGSPAQVSGLKVGDEITHVDGRSVSSWQDLMMKILGSEGSTLTFTVEREDRVHEIQVTPTMEEGRDLFGEKARVPRIGIIRADAFRIEKYSVGMAFVAAGALEWHLSTLTCQALWRLVTGKLSPRTLVGPIGIVSLAGSAAKMGAAAVIQFTGFLSVSLAVLNLLPIPALDGGHLFFLGIESIRRKHLNPRIQDRVTQVGFYFIMALAIFVVFNDLVNLGAIQKLKDFFS